MILNPVKRFLRRIGVALSVWYSRRQGRRGVDAIQQAGDRIGRWHYRLRPIRRMRLKRQIARVLATTPADASVSRILLEAHRTNDRAVFEVVACAAGAITARQMSESVAVSGEQALFDALGSGKGAVLLGMHMGNALALMVYLSTRGMPISVVAYQSKKLPHEFFENVFDSTDVETIPARPEGAAYFRMVRALKRGRAVLVTMDQIHKRDGVSTRFLGKRVTMPSGPAAVARSLDLPVFPVQLLASRPKWTYRIADPLQLPHRETLEEDVAQLAAIMDAHIRAHPELWSWHQRRWIRYPFEDMADSC